MSTYKPPSTLVPICISAWIVNGMYLTLMCVIVHLLTPNEKLYYIPRGFAVGATVYHWVVVFYALGIKSIDEISKKNHDH